MRSVGDSVSDFAGPVLNGFVDGLVMASTFVSEVFTRSAERAGERLLLLVEAVGALGPVLDKVFSGDFRAAYQELEKGNARIKELREEMGLGLIPVVSDLGPILVEAAVAADKMRQRINGVSQATKDAGESAKRGGKQFKSLEQTFEDFLEGFEYADGSTAQIEPLGEDPEEVIGSVDRLNDATLSYLHSVNALADAPPLISQKTLGDIDAFVSGFTAVAGIVGDLAGLYLDAAMQSDNLTEKQKQAAKTAFNVQKAANLATAVVNTALGVTQALASAPPPLSFVNAGLVGAAGAVAIAEIAGQRPPSFAVGGMMPSTGGPAILHPGEGVLSAGAVDSLGGVSALDALNGRSAMGQGGTVVVSWKHLRQSFSYEARDAANRPGPLRSIRRDGRRAGQMRRAVRADYGSL